MASELVLAPVVDRNALRKTEMQMSQAMASAGKKGSIEMQKEVSKRLRSGVRNGFIEGMKSAIPTINDLGKAVSISAAAIVGSTLMRTLGGLDENIDRIMGKLDSVRDITQNAEAFGIDSARYAALSVMGSAAGMDQGDIQGIMAGFVASLKDEEMSGFAQIAKTQGTEKAFFDFLSSSAKLDERARQDQLIATFGEDDFRLVSRFMNPMMQMQAAGQQMNLSSLFQRMTGSNLDLGAISGGLSRTGQAQGIVTQQQTEQLLKSIISGVSPGQAQAVTAVTESQRTLQAVQMSTLELQVKARIIADNLKIEQINAGVATIDRVEATISAAEIATERLQRMGVAGQASAAISSNDPALNANSTYPRPFEGNVNPILSEIRDYLRDIFENNEKSKDDDVVATYRGY